jgi:tRNA nucleotidyltransferase (CCA-adding enzyme)
MDTNWTDCPSAAWWHFSHEADIGVAGAGATLDEAFGNAALAMTRVITAAPVAPRQAVAITVSAPDPELLLVEWLNALVYEMATRRMLFGRFDVRIAGTELQADAYGEPIDHVRHRPAVEVKGATFTALRVAQDSDGRWVAGCVVDV